MSGIVGIGGGIFLSPILFLLKADRPQNIATSASLFILINSISGKSIESLICDKYYQLYNLCNEKLHFMIFRYIKII